MTSLPVRIVAEMTAREGHRHALAELVAAYKHEVLHEPGSVSFDVFTNADDPDRFVIVEEYRDESAFTDHLRSHHCSQFNTSIVGIVDSDAATVNRLIVSTT